MVTKALDAEKVQTSISAEAEMEKKKETRDFETPAFLRKKLLK